jgi:preprotein translocase subunit SecF
MSKALSGYLLPFVFLVISFAPVFVVLWQTRALRGNTILISKRRLFIVLVILTPLSWFSSLVFFLPISPIFLAIAVFVLLRPRELKTVDFPAESAVVLANLKRIQEDLTAAELHMRGLSSGIEVTQRDIEDKEKRRVALQKEIDKQLRDVEAWQKLSQEQKDLFVQTAKEAMRRKSFLEAAAIVGGGLALNLAASLVWALLGAPGKEELSNFFDGLFR